MIEVFLDKITSIVTSDITKLILFNVVLTMPFMETPPMIQLINEETKIYDDMKTDLQILNKFANYETIMLKSKNTIIAAYPGMYLAIVLVFMTAYALHFNQKYFVLVILLFYYKLYLYLNEIYDNNDAGNTIMLITSIVAYTGFAFTWLGAIIPWYMFVICGLAIMYVNKSLAYNEIEKQTGITIGLFPRLMPIASSIPVGTKIIRNFKKTRRK